PRAGAPAAGAPQTRGVVSRALGCDDGDAKGPTPGGAPGLACARRQGAPADGGGDPQRMRAAHAAAGVAIPPALALVAGLEATGVNRDARTVSVARVRREERRERRTDEFRSALRPRP